MTLTLATDAEGALTAAPSIVFTGAPPTADEARTADLIVQAALQCGPYRGSSLRGRAITLPVVFTAANPLRAALTSESPSP